jgi:hypothetical protein
MLLIVTVNYVYYVWAKITSQRPKPIEIYIRTPTQERMGLL